jgi:hypothetical protein
MCSGRVDTPCYTSDSLRVTYVKNPMTNNEKGKKNENGTYPCSSVTQTLRYGQPSLPLGNLSSIATMIGNKIF